MAGKTRLIGNGCLADRLPEAFVYQSFRENFSWKGVWAAPCFLLSPRGAGIVSWRSLYAAPVSDCLAGLISQADVGRPALVRIDSRETETSAIQNAKRRKHARYD
jgi:hypothetical protein